MYKTWTENELKYLADNYGKVPNAEIALKLDRTLRSIKGAKRYHNIFAHPEEVIHKFMNRVAISNIEYNNTPCWEWLGRKTKYGYGQFDTNNIAVLAHRWAYQYFIGLVPDGLELDHLCKNTSCVNATHLEPTTHKENVLRGNGPTAQNAIKTHCINNHAFTPENTYLRTDGGRQCKTCIMARHEHRKFRLANLKK
jgi:hypothetical protein